MKKLFAILMLVVFLAACGNESETPTPSGTPTASVTPTENANDVDEATASLLDYFSTKENTLYVYNGVEEDYTAWNIFNEYIDLENGIVQRKVEASGEYVSELIRFENGEAMLYHAATKAPFIENFKDKEQNAADLILKAPLEKGAKWVADEIRGGMIHCEILSMETLITVPAGSFTCMEVKTTYDDSTTYQLQYYAKGVGFIKQITITDEREYVTELASVTEDTAVTMNVVFFFPIYESKELSYEVRTCQFETNAEMLEFFNTGFVSYEDPANNILPEGALLLSVTKDILNDRAVVNLSKSFAALTEADPEREELMLGSIAYTFAVYYGTERVMLLMEGEPYKSANIQMEENEVWEIPSMSSGEADE